MRVQELEKLMEANGKLIDGLLAMADEATYTYSLNLNNLTLVLNEKAADADKLKPAYEE